MAVNQPQDNWAAAITSNPLRNAVLSYVSATFAALPAQWVGRAMLTADGLQIKVRNEDYSRVVIIACPLEPATSAGDMASSIQGFAQSQAEARKAYSVS